MRGEGASPIYEEDSIIAYVLSGPGKKYVVHYQMLMNQKAILRLIQKNIQQNINLKL